MLELDPPDDPLERLLYLLEIEQLVERELEAAYSRAYFDARLTGQIDAAMDLRRHSRKDILAMTRRLNHEAGLQVSWGDGLDRRSVRPS
jgi:hypothetical protein